MSGQGGGYASPSEPPAALPRVPGGPAPGAWVACRTGPDGFRGANWHPGWMTVEGGIQCCTCGVFVPRSAP